MSTPIVRAGVAAYVAAVRAQLDDLTAEEVDELTGGLEADLDDALDDPAAVASSPEEQFGSAASYAAELRAAAGLPPRTEQGGRRGVGARLARWRDRVLSHPRWPAVRDFLVTIRPAWWVARALVATAVIATAFGLTTFLAFWLGVAAIVVSVQLGRRRTAHRHRAWRVAIGAGNTLAVLLLLPAISLVTSPRGDAVIEGYPLIPQNGIWVNGVEVRNIFPYDDQGRPLSGVQLYDGNGRPVEVGDSARTPLTRDDDSRVAQVPAVDGSGQQRWNVYPLREQASRPDPSSGEDRPDPAGPSPADRPDVTPGPLLAGGSAAATSPSGAPLSPVSPSPAAASPSPAAATPPPTALPSPAAATPPPTASTVG